MPATHVGGTPPLIRAWTPILCRFTFFRAIQWKVLPADHPTIADTHIHLAIVHGSLGNDQERLRHNKAALTIQEKTLPTDHPDLGIIHNNLGVAYSRLGTADMVLRRLSLISQLDAAVTPYTSRHMLCHPTHGA